MRRKTRKKVCCCSLMLLAVIILGSGIQSIAKEKQGEITVIFTHDLHDNLLPQKAEENGEIKEVGGYARILTVVNELKSQNSNVLLLDAGDFSMGTPFQTIYKTEAPELRIMGKMGYDVVTLGNHEYDYRASGLAKSLTSAKKSGDLLPQIVQSNVTFPLNKNGVLSDSLQELKTAMDYYGVKDYTVIEKNGIRIGIFGIMGEASASMAPMSEVVFTDKMEQAKRMVTILKETEKVDFIICLSHTGTNPDPSKSEDEILAKEVPDINVIISGHTHTKLDKPILVGNTIIGSCEEYGKNIGVITCKRGDDLTWSLNNYQLIPIKESIAENTELVGDIKVFKEQVQTQYFDKFGLQYDEVIAKSPYQFQTTTQLLSEHKESELANLITDSYRYAVKKVEGDQYVPIAVTVVPAGTIRGTFLKGDITTADVFSVSSLGMGEDNMPGYPLISLYLTGKELKTICEVDASIAPIMPEAQLFASGLQFTFNPNRIMFNKVVSASLQAEDGTTEEIDDQKLYRVVVGLYSAQMLSVVGEKSYGILSIIPKKEDGTPITNFEDQIIYRNDGGTKKELKEWYALVDYFHSFETVDGVAEIPVYYGKTQNRKNVEQDNSIIAIVKNPNKIEVIIICIPVIFILCLVFLVRKIRKWRRNRTYK